MRRALRAAALVLLLFVWSGATARASTLDAYRVKATAANLDTLANAGFDVTEGRRNGIVEIVATERQVNSLRRTEKVTARKVRSRASGRRARGSRGRRARARAAQINGLQFTGDDSSWAVWRKYDARANDGKEQYTELYARLASRFPKIVKKRVIGESFLGRDIVALQVTRRATGQDIRNRPAVLYNALQHAREWLAGETCRRQLLYFTENYGANTAAGREVTRIVDNTELWFVCVSNPDGYEYTFTDPDNRLWRKNVRDSNGDGQITPDQDGVDPNRNFPTNWGRDAEGSSSNPSSETYRGTGPASEPETRALMRLVSSTHPVFQKNDHTAASLLLYPQGWQQDTLTADNPIFVGLAGTDENSAIKDDEEVFDPDLGAELYITNGDTLDWTYGEQEVLAYTPEGTPARDPNVSGFEFEDSEQEIQEEFLRHLPFSLDLAQAAKNPTEIPGNQFGTRTPDFEVDSFADSYGSPQSVQVNVKRSLGRVQMRYRIGSGRTQTADTGEFRGGEEYYGDDDVYYHRVRGMVRGAGVGDQVRVWFTARGRRSAAFTYTRRERGRDPVLIVANEDYTGASPAQTITAPQYLGSYTAALQANGVGYDVYDVDAHARRAPHPLGVLSHYRAVIWYTGEDIITREVGQPPGTVSKLANDIQLAMRDYINEGGKLFFTGKYAGFAQGIGAYAYDADQGSANGDGPCTDPDSAFEGALSECVLLTNDFLQYYLGAHLYADDAGTSFDDDGNPTGLFSVSGIGDPFTAATYPFNGPDSADNQDHSASFLVTSSILKPDEYPEFADSRRLGIYNRDGAAPYEPFTGQYFAAANADDASYKRLRRTIDLTGGTAGQLTFQTSYDLEADYDYMFVEAHPAQDDPATPGDEREDWTTLPDANGHTSTDTGLSCPSQTPASDWQSLHPFLTHYQTKTGPDTCLPTGTTGEWNAATANSGGWNEWEIDLSGYAGQQVEVSITVATDPASLGLGVWIDDASATVDGQPLFETSFEEEGLGGFTAGPPPPGTDSPANGWERTVKQFDEGPLVGTDETLYTGFGFEGIQGAANRKDFMGRALEHLGVK